MYDMYDMHDVHCMLIIFIQKLFEAWHSNVRGERARPGATTGGLKASSDLAWTPR